MVTRGNPKPSIAPKHAKAMESVQLWPIHVKLRENVQYRVW